MTHRQRRHIAAWTLLAVFVPTLLLGALHRHHPQPQTDCGACVAHQPHAGHVGQPTQAPDECPLCQFYNTTYLPSETPVLTPCLTSATQSTPPVPQASVRQVGPVSLRAPPVWNEYH